MGKSIDVSTPKYPGMVAIVDDKDFELVSKYKWHVVKYRHLYYAARNMHRDDGVRTLIRLHTQIMSPLPGQVIDHKNGNGLDCQRENMRICMQGRNSRNRRKSLTFGKASKYKGVSFHKRDQQFTAQIGVNRKVYHLGYFLSEIEAAKAYNTAAIKFHGDFAQLNQL